MHSFSVFKAIDFGFRMFGRHIWLMLGLLSVELGVEFGTDFTREIIMQKAGISTYHESKEGSESVKEETPKSLHTMYSEITSRYKKNPLAFTLQFLIFLLARIFIFILFVGWNRIALDLYDSGTSKFNRVFAVIPFFLTYLVAAALYIAMFMGGLILLIIPGIILGLKYGFFDLIIFDTGCGPIEALSKSGQLTYGHKWKLLLFGLTCSFLILISTLTIILPSILTYVFILSRAYIYRTLQEIQKNKAQAHMS
jgi:uncharacterized membrane protein